MGLGSLKATTLAEQSLLPLGSSSAKRRLCHHYNYRRKKHKFLSLENETRFHIHPSHHNSVRKFSSYSQRQERNRRKSYQSLNHRNWTYSDYDPSGLADDKVVLVSYNILGVENAAKHPELYPDVPPKYLDWQYRKRLIGMEVKTYKPSIMCFQEVDRFDDLNHLFVKNGFKGVFQARPGEASDGCAIFWKANQFTLLHEESINFQKFGLRNNVAQFCVLKMNTSQASYRSLLVGNIHVLFNPKRGDIKLGQMRIFLQKAYELSKEWGSIPVVITGDHNSLPQSAIYQFLASSELHVNQHDRRNISGQTWYSEYSGWKKRWTEEELMLATGSSHTHMKHPLKLSSAYAKIPGSLKYRDEVGEPLVTSYHGMFNGTVDYIWHTSDLAPVRVLETLPVKSLKENGFLPSKKWGSDHFALVCEFAFTDNAG